MIQRLGEKACRWAERLFPDPFVFALLLTFLTAVASFAAVPSGAKLLESWQGAKGFWSLLAFGMQMCLILVTGHALASTPQAGRMIKKLAALPRSAGGAAALVAAASIVCAYLNWGLGLIVGALLAREAGLAARKRGIAIHYPLVVASGYVGLAVWHGGLSGSAPLKSTTASDLMEMVKDPALVAQVLGKPTEALSSATKEQLMAMPGITLDRTLGSGLNLALCAVLLLIIPLLCALMAPKDPAACEAIPDGVAGDGELEPERGTTLAEGLDHSRLLAWGMAALGLTYLARFYWQGGLMRLDPNVMNATLLFIGIALHGTPLAYVRAVEQAAKGTAGIILQFPFYAGIMGLMIGSGLVERLAEGMNAIATAQTLPLFTFLSACMVNVFIPSGGGQWAVQGPVVLQSAVSLGVAPEKVIMGLAYGDQLTNLLQPFWALPLLGITGLKAGQIMGYTILLMLLILPVFALALLVF